jgi:hypothetical protein
MSRHLILSNIYDEVVVGWDEALQAYFAYVMVLRDDDEEYLLDVDTSTAEKALAALDYYEPSISECQPLLDALKKDKEEHDMTDIQTWGKWNGQYIMH